ncbi:MAG: cobyrinate a,c-diamide synthase, partial [Clostridiales bacterium]
KYLFDKSLDGGDIGIVEGVMGLYDGQGTRDSQGSTAYMAKTLGLPVILLVNAKGMALSLAALLKGFVDFDPDVDIRGVILNGIKNPTSSFAYYKQIVEELAGLPLLGILPYDEHCSISSRHLGLVCRDEVDGLENKLERLGALAKDNIDLARLVNITSFKKTKYPKPLLPQPLKKKIVLGYAWDKAFNFYYQDSLDLLQELGAELVPVSPLRDKYLPQEIAGLYLGGGYPEIFAEELAANRIFTASLREKLAQGMPCYAECGGYMYLGRSITDQQNRRYEMAGFLPLDFQMTKQLNHFGYVDVEMLNDNILGKAGQRVKGHEFHYSALAGEGIDSALPCYLVHKKSKNLTWSEGRQIGSVLGAYPHLHLWGQPVLAANFLQKAALWFGEVNS